MAASTGFSYKKIYGPYAVKKQSVWPFFDNKETAIIIIKVAAWQGPGLGQMIRFLNVAVILNYARNITFNAFINQANDYTTVFKRT